MPAPDPATPAEVKARFPEFAVVDDDRIQIFIDDATLIMGRPRPWGDYYKMAMAYLVGHFLYLGEASATGDGDAVGPIKRKEVDETVIEQAVSASSQGPGDNYEATAYGMRYLQVVRLLFSGPVGVL